MGREAGLWEQPGAGKPGAEEVLRVNGMEWSGEEGGEQCR